FGAFEGDRVFDAGHELRGCRRVLDRHLDLAVRRLLRPRLVRAGLVIGRRERYIDRVDPTVPIAFDLRSAFEACDDLHAVSPFEAVGGGRVGPEFYGYAFHGSWTCGPSRKRAQSPPHSIG